MTSGYTGRSVDGVKEANTMGVGGRRTTRLDETVTSSPGHRSNGTGRRP